MIYKVWFLEETYQKPPRFDFNLTKEAIKNLMWELIQKEVKTHATNKIFLKRD